MSINIKDPKTDEIIRRLALKEDVSITEAVHKAVAERLDRLERQQDVTFVTDIMAIAKRYASYPVTDAREPDDMLYDENGMPA